MRKTRQAATSAIFHADEPESMKKTRQTAISAVFHADEPEMNRN